MQNIGIYCSASVQIRPFFRLEAIKLGKWIGENQKTLVNGGSNQGLMEVFSKSVQEHGGKCIGVIPEVFSNKGWYSQYTDEIILVKDLSERKDRIKRISDILLVYPGGIGTLDEFFDAWASYTLGYHDKKIVLLNLKGFFNPLLKMLSQLRTEHFLHESQPSPLYVMENVEQAIQFLKEI
jgi:uncharacterized protein (TIGR00730 family)